MEDENYKLLLEQIDAQKKLIDDLSKKVDDVTNLNRTLLSRSGDSATNDEEKEMRELQEKLGRCLKWQQKD